MPFSPDESQPCAADDALLPVDDEARMLRALQEAQKARDMDEAPVGALVLDPAGRLIGTGFDRRRGLCDPTAHAEILALRQAALALGDWRLQDCSLYVTLEPCPMCAGALILSRIRTLVFGAHSDKSGAVESLVRLLDVHGFNHCVQVRGGVLAEPCGRILSDYFSSKRNPAVADRFPTL